MRTRKTLKQAKKDKSPHRSKPTKNEYQLKRLQRLLKDGEAEHKE